MVSAKPVYVFRELMHYMAEQCIVAPGYTYMQDTVGQALTYEQQRLTTILSQYLDQSAVANLNRLLQDSPGLYEITQLKREPKDFSASEIKCEIHRGEQIRELLMRAAAPFELLAIGVQRDLQDSVAPLQHGVFVLVCVLVQFDRHR